jgi:hypothetical protein
MSGGCVGGASCGGRVDVPDRGADSGDPDAGAVGWGGAGDGYVAEHGARVLELDEGRRAGGPRVEEARVGRDARKIQEPRPRPPDDDAAWLDWTV